MHVAIMFWLVLCATGRSHRATPAVHRRQTQLLEGIIPTQYASQCKQVAQALSSCVDDSCLCPTLASAGPPCTSCVTSYNTYEASALGAAIPLCQSKTFTPSPCYTECARSTHAAWVCIEDACYCPILVADGLHCSQCLASHDEASEANFYGTQVTACQTELAAMPTVTQMSLPPFNPCGPYCNSVNQAAATCTDDKCLCPVMLQEGQVCSECWQSFNTAQANVLASEISICRSEGLW